ncbi:unnamed protein product [Rhizoctonia solani]|uniref:Uncharacterized protein n=1 Tax=Rhizoctonia solani TaxID=456999 RepID=A0A8H2XR84_9AGAM|nr:unnamed protein product [Rhizoctonia solani]
MAAPARGPVSRKRALSAAPPPSFEACVVTYFSQDRAFQRVFAETDIEGMKTVVREKLNLSPHTGVRLAQVADGRRIDLEDDADFYAFQLGAQLKPELQVEVSVITAPAAQLASPSVTATSINLERAPPPTLVQTGQDATPQAVDASTSPPPPPKKKKKPRKSNLVIVDNTPEGSSKPTESLEAAATEQASEGPNPEAKAANAAPSTTTTEPSKKPKSKAAAKPTPAVGQEAPPISDTSKQPNNTVEAPPVPPKSAKSKKAAATIPVPTATEPAPTSTEPTPESPVSVDTEIPQPRPKKRGRKAVQDAQQPDPTVPEPTTQVVVEPPVKKQRKSKLDAAIDLEGTQSPVAISLPPPVRSKRRSSTVASIPDTGKPVSAVGSATDILRRWGALSIANEAGGSEAGPSTTTDPVDQSMETKGKVKRKRKKKDQVADGASTSTSIPVSTPAETTQCLLCSSGPHEPLDCPLLSQRDATTCKTVEDHIYRLEDTQGPARIHQMLIGRLRAWLKDTKKQVEVQNKSITPTPAPTVPKSASPIYSTPIPTRPKKSKLSSVAVSHQSEGSSTEDEDILKSVMEIQIESAEEDDGEDEEMVDIPQPELECEPLQEASPPSTSTLTPSPQPAAVPLPPSSSPATKALLQSQRMSRSGVRALLDGLEEEEAGEGEKDSSDDEASDLAQSTPSEIARRRYRKSVRLDVRDSDEEAAARGQALPQDEDGSDVEMQDGEHTTLSQLLASPEPEEIVGVVGDGNGEDDIEEYEDDKEGGNKVLDGTASSPIETADQEPAMEEDQHPVPAEEEEAAEAAHEEEAEPVKEEPEPDQEPEPEPVSPSPKRRGRPSLSQAIKEERAAEKSRIQAEKAATQADSSVPKKRGRPPRSKGAEEQADTSINGKPKSTESSTQDQSGSVAGSQESGPRPRGRPRLSETVKAEREAEKERIRAEKAIQRLEKKTAKANAKAAAKGKGADTSTTVDDDEDGEEDMTLRQSLHAPEEATESPVVPTWSTLKSPSSSRHGSSQADEIESSATEVPGDAEGPSGFQLSTVKPTPNTRSRKDSAPPKPLFMPSSGLGPRFLPYPSPLASTPGPGKLLSLTQPQQTPSNALQRRKSVGSASLPRFTDIRKNRDIQQRSRKERNKLLSSQPAFDSSQELKSKPNGASEDVVVVESSEEEVDSSDEEAKKPKSQRKRPSAFAYFSQQ